MKVCLMKVQTVREFNYKLHQFSLNQLTPSKPRLRCFHCLIKLIITILSTFYNWLKVNLVLGVKFVYKTFTNMSII